MFCLTELGSAKNSLKKSQRGGFAEISDRLQISSDGAERDHGGGTCCWPAPCWVQSLAS